MPSFTVSIAAASAPLDTDLVSGERWKETANDRVLVGAALKGSAAAGDTEVDLLVDETRIATLFNSNTGFPNDDDVVPMGYGISANMEVSAIVRDAPATNPINLRLDFS